MANKDSNAKARKTTIQLGDLCIDGFELPPSNSGNYVCSKQQIVQLLGLDWRRFAQLQRLKLAQVLIPNGLKVSAVSTETGKIDGIPVEQVPLVWALSASRGNEFAILLLAACTSESLERRFDKSFDNLRTDKERNERIIKRSRISEKHCPWERLYEKEMCIKIKKWYGFDSSKFYWWYVYNFLTPQERAELETHNPVLKVVSKNGKERTARKRKIHQHLTEETLERLKDFAEYLWKCIDFCDSRVEFEKKWSIKYGLPTQLEIFDLWEFAS